MTRRRAVPVGGLSAADAWAAVARRAVPEALVTTVVTRQATRWAREGLCHRIEALWYAGVLSEVVARAMLATIRDLPGYAGEGQYVWPLSATGHAKRSAWARGRARRAARSRAAGTR